VSAAKKKRAAKPAATPQKAAPKTSRKAAPKATRKRAAHPHASLLDELVQRAKAVRENAHSPYSSYAVGAAIATKSGRIFEGCNVENASLGATICAERGAIMQMVAAGEREPIACAVVTGDVDGASPCGICRQVLSEFAKDMPIVLVGLGSRDGETGRVVQLADLLPLAFEFRR
jgi:cytidine deaminase